jgi:transposase, IS5 family
MYKLFFLTALAHVTPSTGAVYADKGYCTKPSQIIAKRKGLHLAAIKNNNMKDKNRDKDDSGRLCQYQF